MTLPDWLSNLIAQVQAMPSGRRFAFGATAIGSLSFFLWLALAAGGSEERLLYRHLAEDEAARVVDGLAAEKIPYRLADGGASVYVPASAVHEARIRLASKGLPGGRSPGFEIFDETGFGVTDFVNRVNYQRALQGELARSIEQLEAVERARVQIAIPERRGFSSRKVEPSASVVVKLHSGYELQPLQSRGIVHLVASSIEGLAVGRVTLVDNRGHMLSSDAEALAGPAPTGALQHQQRLEQELVSRIEAMLEPTVGAGRVVARVTAKLDWTQSESTQESFDPDSQVARSEELVEEESSDGKDVASGVPGIASNNPGEPSAAGGSASSQSTRTSETINYEISKTVSRTIVPVGTVEQLDVAVLVDGAPTEDGSFAEWDAESLQQFEELAMRAVGFSAERGDQITITNAPFQSMEVGPETPFWLQPELLILTSTVLRFLGIAVALLIFAKLVASPVLAKLGSQSSAVLPARAEELELELAAAGSGAGTLNASADSAPPLAPAGNEEAVKALRVWLSER